MHNSWDLKADLTEKIKKNGGWINCHLHLDRAYTITPQSLHLADKTLKEKWDLVDEVKRSSSINQIYDRMAFGIEEMISQGVSALCSFIDVDDVVKDKSMIAAERVREKYKKDIVIKYANQALKGVIEPKAYEWFLRGSEFVDIIGGLPGRDKGHEEEHLDVLFLTAKRLNKMVHVHVDQFNSPSENETELLVKKTLEHHMSGKVVAIHGISIGAHSLEYRTKLYTCMKEANIMLITCPTAWIDSRRNEVLTPTHNSIVPVEELIANDLIVGIGTDNIADIYKPFTDGSLWMELRFLLESCHYYDMKNLLLIATKNGRKILGM